MKKKQTTNRIKAQKGQKRFVPAGEASRHSLWTNMVRSRGCAHTRGGAGQVVRCPGRHYRGWVSLESGCGRPRARLRTPASGVRHLARRLQARSATAGAGGRQSNARLHLAVPRHPPIPGTRHERVARCHHLRLHLCRRQHGLRPSPRHMRWRGSRTRAAVRLSAAHARLSLDRVPPGTTARTSAAAPAAPPSTAAAWACTAPGAPTRPTPSASALAPPAPSARAKALGWRTQA